jgi:membrane protein YdbS with pleckstrin-like domain
MSPEALKETLRWTAYPSWAHFTWLYFFCVLLVMRGIVVFRLGISGGEVWLGGAGALFLCVIILRRWAQYGITSQRAFIKNGFTNREIQTVRIADICRITVEQGPIAKFFEVGTLLIESNGTDQVLMFRGIRDPTVISTRLQAMRSGEPTADS